MYSLFSDFRQRDHLVQYAGKLNIADMLNKASWTKLYSKTSNIFEVWGCSKTYLHEKTSEAKQHSNNGVGMKNPFGVCWEYHFLHILNNFSVPECTSCAYIWRFRCVHFSYVLVVKGMKEHNERDNNGFSSLPCEAQTTRLLNNTNISWQHYWLNSMVIVLLSVH